MLAVAVTTFIGGYAGAATGELNPFIAVADLTSVDAILVILLVAIVVQGLAANITNVYTAGLSLLNAVPSLGRFRSTLVAAVVAIGLCAFPGFIQEAQTWISHLGNLGAPLAGVVLADYVVLKHSRFDPAGLFDPRGPYRYLGGVNVAAVVAIAGRHGGLLRGAGRLDQGRLGGCLGCGRLPRPRAPPARRVRPGLPGLAGRRLLADS